MPQEDRILNESKTRRKILAMAWIDSKKAYDMDPQSWIVHCLKMYTKTFLLENNSGPFLKWTRKELIT